MPPAPQATETASVTEDRPPAIVPPALPRRVAPEPAAVPEPVPERPAAEPPVPAAAAGTETVAAAPRPAPAPAAPDEVDFARALEISHDATEDAAAWYAATADLPASNGATAPQPSAPQPAPSTPQPARTVPAADSGRPPAVRTAATARPAMPARRPAPRIVDLDAERSLPSIERALSAPNARRDVSWRRRVKVVVGGQGPGKRDQESLDRDRARLPLATPRRIVVLGSHGGAGQTITALLTGRLLATLREHRVVALDLNATTGEPGTRSSGGDLDIVAAGSSSPDYEELAKRYPLTIIDPAPSGLTRVLDLADQLVIVVPPTPEGASSLANTQQWLDAHGQGDLAARAVTVVNGVSKQTMADVLRAESVARGRCRAIVRVPWDEQLTAKHPQIPQTPQTRLAYIALAGVVVAGMAAPAPGSGRSPGEHEG